MPAPGSHSMPKDPSPTPPRDWDSLARQHHHRVVVFLLSRGLTLDDANDVAQQTWARLVDLDRQGRLAFVRLPGLALKQAWFIAARHRQDGARWPSGGEAELVADEHADPETVTLARDQFERALEELSRLPPSAQAVFRYVLLDPKTPHAEIARKVGLSEQRVRQTVCEVRARLRTAVGGALT